MTKFFSSNTKIKLQYRQKHSLSFFSLNKGMKEKNKIRIRNSNNYNKRSQKINYVLKKLKNTLNFDRRIIYTPIQFFKKN